jgi:protein TonB
VQFNVSPKGLVEDIEVVESEPGDLFVEATTEAVSGWRFEPGMKDGKPVFVRMVTNLFFELEG